MAAASFLVPSLSGLGSRPNRIRHSVRVNIRRRERITPPPILIQNRQNSCQVSTGDQVNIDGKSEHIKDDLEAVQKKHIRNQMRHCFRPFRLFLSAIGRFPYKVVKEKSKREELATIEQNLSEKNRKGSNFPLLHGFVNQVLKRSDESEKFEEEDDLEETSRRFEYDPWSVRGIAYTTTSSIVLLILILSLWGYADLCLTIFDFEKVDSKMATRSNFKILESLRGQITDERNLALTKRSVLNCTMVVWQKYLMVSKRHESWNNNIENFLGLDYEELMSHHGKDVIRCQTAKDLKRIVDDNLIFLIVMLACTLNTIFQSTVPLFHGNLQLQDQTKLFK